MGAGNAFPNWDHILRPRISGLGMVENVRAERRHVVAGIDVGGTFTDLILIDGRDGGRSISPRRPLRRKTRLSGWLPRLTDSRLSGRRHRPHRARHDDDHQRGAGAPAGKDRHDHHPRLSRHHRTRPPDPAASLRHDRRFRAGHPARSPAGGVGARRGRRRRARAARRGRVSRRGGAAARRPAANRWSSIFSIPMPILRTKSARREIAAELWPNDHITAGHTLLSEAREFERGVTAASMPPCSRS